MKQRISLMYGITEEKGALTYQKYYTIVLLRYRGVDISLKSGTGGLYFERVPSAQNAQKIFRC